MSFTITIQKNTSEKNQLDKDLSTLTTLSGNLKDKSSIVDPVILVEGNINTLAQANYMTIPIFNRKYFITDVIAVRKDLFEIHGHCDVLSSFKSGIRSNKAIIQRQEKKWNLYVDDGVFRTYQNPQIVTKPFPHGFTDQQFILCVAGSI